MINPTDWVHQSRDVPRERSLLVIVVAVELLFEFEVGVFTHRPGRQRSNRRRVDLR